MVYSGNGLNTPYGIASVTNGATTYVWVLNHGNNTISVFNTDGSASGLGPYSGNGLNNPLNLSVVGTQVWVVNNPGQTISRFNPDGTSAGSVISANRNDGPLGLTMVGSSEVWVSFYDGQIEIFNTDGTTTGTIYAGIVSNLYPIAYIISATGNYVWYNGFAKTVIVNSTGSSKGLSAARNCGVSDPCKTFLYGTSKASAGDTVIINSGTYGPQTISANGTAGNLITIEPESGGSVTLTRDNPASNKLQGASLLNIGGTYLHVTGFTVIGMKGRTDWVKTIYAGGATTTSEVQSAGGSPAAQYITFDNFTIENSTSSCLKMSGGSTIQNNTMTNCGVWPYGTSHGIYISEPNTTVKNNTITNTPGYGIHAYQTSDPVNYEIIQNNVISKAAAGILVWGGINATVSGNLVYNNGMGMDFESNGHMIYNNIVVNNTYNQAVLQYDTSANYLVDKNITSLEMNHSGLAVVGSQVWLTNDINNSISRLNTDGTTATSDITGNGLNNPQQMAIVNSQVWVSNYDNNTISRFNQDGTSAGSVISGNGLNRPAGIVQVGSYAWVANTGACQMSKFNLDGSSAGLLSASICANPLALVVSGGSSYVWAGSNGSTSIKVFDTSGNLTSTITGNGIAYPNGISVIGSQIWVSDNAAYKISRFNPDGSAIDNFGVIGSLPPTQIAVVGSNVWVATNKQSSSRIAYGFNFSAADSGINIYNNTFYGNYREIAPYSGSSSFNIENNIFDGTSFTGSTAINLIPTSSTIDYNDYNNITAPASPGTHSFTSTDPLMVNPGSSTILAGNYKLQPSSPAINVGTDLSSTFTTDYAGTTRPQGSAFDIGAYEFILPSAPSSLAQYKSDGTTSIASSSWTNESTVVLKFLMSSSNSSDTLTPQVEIEPNGTAFTNTVTNSGSAVAYSGSPVTGTVTATGLTSGQTYHWQARVSNSAGTGSWTSSGGSPDFGADTTRPTSLSLNSPAGYTTDNRPTLVFKKATDAGSGVASYTVTLDSGKNRNFSVSGIPVSGNGSSDYVWKDDSSVKVEFLNENDSDTSNDEIHVYFKDLNNIQLTEGKHTWNVTAYDNVGNSASQSQDFYIDRSSPSISQLAVANVAIVQSGQVYNLSILNRMPSFSGLATDSYQGSTVTNSNGTTDTFDKVSSGPQTITLTLKLQKDDKTYIDYLTKDFSLSNIQDTSGDKKSTRFYVTTPFPIVDGYYQVNITLKDGAGNTFTQPTFYLSIKNNLPGPLQSLFTGNLETKVTEQKTVPAQTVQEKQAVKQNGYIVKVKVIDTKNLPIAGAKVTIHSKVQETITDKDGIALFNSIEPGQHKILIAYANYQGEQTVNLTGDVKEFDFNIQVKETNAFLNPKVIAVIGVLVLALVATIILLLRAKKKVA